MHNGGVSHKFPLMFSTERNPFAQFFGFSFIHLRRICCHPFNPDATSCHVQWSNFTKTYWHSVNFFFLSPDSNNFFESRADVVRWNAGLFTIFRWKRREKFRGLKRRVHHPRCYTIFLLCLISVRNFLLIHLFFDRYTYLPSSEEKKIVEKDSMECLLDNN